MKRTTVYLNDEDAEGLRRLSSATGTSQASLIREGIRRVLGRKEHRKFHSMAQGKSLGPANLTSEDLADLYSKKLGLD